MKIIRLFPSLLIIFDGESRDLTKFVCMQMVLERCTLLENAKKKKEMNKTILLLTSSNTKYKK